MTSFLKFVYIMVLFLSLFLIATDVKAFLKCDSDLDCPPKMCYSHLSFVPLCVDNHCDCIQWKFKNNIPKAFP
ncbi:Nodule Cysteine-Rich (NCR) secreted peptide [Medicago truncatula]|uniref:Nodule Cysteine-Rich (NCR) secreted peptide n=2 Tax=Medicago truncatula TaxID=3880 RepID=G7K939_MEDTR|nr:Nodule Cysteine-Rich (NCR) secreted peptide [Medicago truncatula]